MFKVEKFQCEESELDIFCQSNLLQSEISKNNQINIFDGYIVLMAKLVACHNYKHKDILKNKTKSKWDYLHWTRQSSRFSS